MFCSASKEGKGDRSVGSGVDGRRDGRWSGTQHVHDSQREQLGPAGGRDIRSTLPVSRATADRAERRLIAAMVERPGGRQQDFKRCE